MPAKYVYEFLKIPAGSYFVSPERLLTASDYP